MYQAEAQGFCIVGAMLLLQFCIHGLLKHATAQEINPLLFVATTLQLLAADCSPSCNYNSSQ